MTDTSDPKVKRADLRRQRSETAWAERRRNATTPMQQLGVEWSRVLQRARKSSDPDTAVAWLLDEVRKLGDRL